MYVGVNVWRWEPMAAGLGWPGGNVERVSANVLVEKPGSARTGRGGKRGLCPASQGAQALVLRGRQGSGPEKPHCWG